MTIRYCKHGYKLVAFGQRWGMTNQWVTECRRCTALLSVARFNGAAGLPSVGNPIEAINVEE